MINLDDLRSILDHIVAGTHTDTEIAALRNELLVGREWNTVQLGKYAINIGQGQDIWIGDHVYRGPNAEAIQQAIRQVLDEYRLRPGVPFQAPPLPLHFVPRPEASGALKAHLLTDEDTAPGVLVVSAIHGLGGIGKSVLAAALAHDPEVQKRFSDGILWATLGQQPDLLSLLSGWIQALGDYDFRPTVVEAASTHLRTLLHDKAALLVVDDVWDPSHAFPFKVGSPRCQVLITTRRADVADEIGAELHQLDVMTLEQSLDLLSARLGRSLAEAERDEVLLLAKAVGYLPLALELAAARVARGIPWRALRSALKEEIARLEALESPRRRRVVRPRLEASFNLSLNALRTEDEEAWASFVWLGVLPEDVLVAAPMAATLWNMDETDASEMLEILWNDALLLSATSIRVGEETWPAYRIHDLLHDIARRLMTAPPEPRRTGDLPGVGLTLPGAHAHLLARYQAQTQDELWHTLPDDGYVHKHLAWHMERAGQIEAIHALLRQETEEGRNAWYEAKEAIGATAGFLDDVARAWRLAEEDFATRNSHLALGLQCRSALSTTSVNDLVRKLPPTLIAALVKERIWTPAQGLAYARQVSPRRRVEALAGLAPHLPEPLLGEALAEAWEIRGEGRWAEALAGLAPHLPEELLCETLAKAWEIRADWQRAKALVRLAPYLSEPLLQEALAAAREIRGEGRAEALVRLAPWLTTNLSEGQREDVLREAIVAVREIRVYSQRAEALAGLAPYLSEPLLQEALAVAREIQGADDRASALIQLASHSPEEQREDVLREAMAALREIRGEWQRAEALVRLAPWLTTNLSEGQREDVLREAIVAVREIRVYPQRAEALAGLAPYLSEPLLQEALAVAREIQGADDRASALIQLASHSPEEQREDVLREALAREIRRKWRRAETLVRLAPYLPERLVGEALAAVQEIQNEWDRAEVLAELVPYLSEPLLQEALAAAWEIQDADYKARALAQLAPHLPEGQREDVLREALAATQEIRDEESQTRAIVGLVSCMEQLGHPREALAAAQEIRGKWRRAEELAGRVPHLPEEMLREELATVQEMGAGWEKMEKLAELALYLPEPSRGDALRGALAAAPMFRDDEDQAEALSKLAFRMAELGHPAEAVATAQDILDSVERAAVLAMLAPRLADLGYAEEGLAAAREIRGERWRAEALVGLAPHLVQLPRERLYPLWQETLPILAARTRKDLLADLRALGPVIAALGGGEAVAETVGAIQDVGRWWP